MTIAWPLFTPWSALLGGLLIGLATALFVLGNGRVAGIAGIVASPLRAVLGGTGLAPERTRLLFLAGLLLAPWLWRLLFMGSRRPKAGSQWKSKTQPDLK